LKVRQNRGGDGAGGAKKGHYSDYDENSKPTWKSRWGIAEKEGRGLGKEKRRTYRGGALPSEEGRGGGWQAKSLCFPWRGDLRRGAVKKKRRRGWSNSLNAKEPARTGPRKKKLGENTSKKNPEGQHKEKSETIVYGGPRKTMGKEGGSRKVLPTRGEKQELVRFHWESR